MVQCEASIRCREPATHVIRLKRGDRYACEPHAIRTLEREEGATIQGLPTVYVAIIDYGETAEPTPLVGTSEHVVMAAAVAELLAGEAAKVTDAFLAEHPRPDYTDERAVAAWLEALETAYFVPMVSVEPLPILPHLPRP